MSSFWKSVNKVIEDADIILEVIDARNPESTRNEEIESKVERSGRKLIYVINKCDLVEDKTKLDELKHKLKNSVFVSSSEYFGMKMLKEKIIIAGKKTGFKKPRVGVVGYPNVGKSSVINALKGTASAPTSPYSGFTRGVRNVSAKGFMLIDTPGVIPYKEDKQDHAMTGAVDFTKIKDPEDAVFELMEKFPRLLQKHYSIDMEGDEFLEEFARKKKLIKKGAVLDTRRAAVFIMKEWQTGKIKI